jgi:hypothetical protein
MPTPGHDVRVAEPDRRPDRWWEMLVRSHTRTVRSLEPE